MKEFLIVIKTAFSNSALFWICFTLIVADCIFGSIRAVKERKFNSCVGINGMLRKIAMLLSIAVCVVLDIITHRNLLAFVPGEITAFFNITKVGIADFFSLMYIAYEAVSVLKNLTLCGVNTGGVYKFVRRFLSKYTTELPKEN